MHKGRIGVGVIAVVVAGLVAASVAGASSQGSTKQPPTITVGFLQILGASPAATRNEVQFKRAAKVLGWKVNVVDAQGDPAKMASGIQSFVTQKVDAIVTIAVAPAAAQQALTAAKKAGIPAITIAGPNPDPNKLYAAQIAPNDSALGAMSAQHLCDTLGKGAKIVAQFFDPLDALVRRDTVAKAVFGNCGVKVVASHQVDFSNAVADATKSTLNMLQAHPEATGVWADQDFEFSAAVNAVKQLGADQEGEGLRVPRRRRDAQHPAGRVSRAVSLADADYNPLCLGLLPISSCSSSATRRRSTRTRSTTSTRSTPSSSRARTCRRGQAYPYPDPAGFFVEPGGRASGTRPSSRPARGRAPAGGGPPTRIASR